tara:strand:- start:1757 stop:1933 length:177 start_codon:yes stop_codon:yes gene_type:complete
MKADSKQKMMHPYLIPLESSGLGCFSFVCMFVDWVSTILGFFILMNVFFLLIPILSHR